MGAIMFALIGVAIEAGVVYWLCWGVYVLIRVAAYTFEVLKALKGMKRRNKRNVQSETV